MLAFLFVVIILFSYCFLLSLSSIHANPFVFDTFIDEPVGKRLRVRAVSFVV